MPTSDFALDIKLNDPAVFLRRANSISAVRFVCGPPGTLQGNLQGPPPLPAKVMARMMNEGYGRGPQGGIPAEIFCAAGFQSYDRRRKRAHDQPGIDGVD